MMNFCNDIQNVNLNLTANNKSKIHEAVINIHILIEL